MSSPLIANLRRQCDGPRDGALLRYSLGQALLNDGDAAGAVAELQRALDFDPNYSAAWKLLGKAQLALGQTDAARAAWTQGLRCAEAKGDAQVVKELGVFLRRLDKAGTP